MWEFVETTGPKLREFFNPRISVSKKPPETTQHALFQILLNISGSGYGWGVGSSGFRASGWDLLHKGYQGRMMGRHRGQNILISVLDDGSMEGERHTKNAEPLQKPVLIWLDPVV